VALVDAIIASLPSEMNFENSLLDIPSKVVSFAFTLMHLLSSLLLITSF